MSFLDQQKEYKIEDMYPKRPLMNYLWNEEYIATIDQFGFGKGRMAAENNFQRNIVKDSESRLLFIKDNEEIFSPNRNYHGAKFQTFETIVGIGYSTIISEYKGIRTEFTILVPHTGKRELWRVKLSNTSDTNKNFDLYAFCETDSRITEHLACNMGDFYPDLNGICFTHKVYASPTEFHAVHFATNAKVEAYETAKRRFVGTYGHITSPIALKKPYLSSTGNSFDADTMAILQTKISLKAGESKDILYTVGVEKNIEDAIAHSKAILNLKVYQQEMALLKEQTNQYDRKVYIHTPDEEVNRFANIWLKRQLDLGKTWGRVYNKGFRDIMQDIAGFVSLDTDASRAKLLDTISHQKEDGNTLRSWVPLDLRPYRDGAVWLLMTVVTYLKETKDLSLLKEMVGYYNSDIRETVWDHCIRGIDFLYRETGENGLCLWGGGDWNDSFDGAGLQMKGESVWLSLATVKATNDFLSLLSFLKKDDLVAKYTKLRDEMTKQIQKVGWDKDHYIYGINDWKEKVGSYENKEGQIFLNPQTWAVLSHVVPNENALLDMVERELSCPFGYVQQKPCYTTPDPHVGRISYFGKGFYENGSVYNHGVAFKIVADCEANRPNEAYATLQKLLPSNPLNDYKKSGVEPYALCNMYFGPENEQRSGEAPMHWITGTSSWTFRGIIEYILGVRAEYDGLVIDPKLPDAWNHVSITRQFRNAVYHIDIQKGSENSIIVDGAKISGSILPDFADGKEHKVTVGLHQ